MSIQDKQTNVLVCGFAGGLSGIVVDFVIYPLESIKTQIQATTQRIDFKEKAAKNHNYKGFSAQFVSSFPFAFIYFYTYEKSKQILQLINNLNNNVQHMIAAALSEILANIFRSPFEVVKQQQQVGWDKQILHTIKSVYNLKGIQGFYAGFGTMILRDIPFSMIQLPVYDLLKQNRQQKKIQETKQKTLSFSESCFCGGTAAALASFCTTPMDVLKSKLMTQRDNYYKGFIDVFQKTIQDEGPRGLFKGVLYRVLPFSFTGTIFFTVYEQTQNIINRNFY
ncbi:mitochondrial carrier protein, putative [Ichthyophthirius multifiliis]|uniref:Mitochondrial carrier protein, putative n=1 Tax=Ichthyophthirius multifiliis TaxID=5932 RepID=G0R2K3_ICHMU|nr:mitochondrial carrier protein, putative [Ichthyophthirius multifiliis]EGR28303.1 mitochondrial carrier protein, putative [Ichthyophthirius multifiliis]|eukprot:XP_004027648.1 mitochondrial carrier protein, putative [Ichthyophthirius multifiliis]